MNNGKKKVNESLKFYIIIIIIHNVSLNIHLIDFCIFGTCFQCL